MARFLVLSILAIFCVQTFSIQISYSGTNLNINVAQKEIHEFGEMIVDTCFDLRGGTLQLPHGCKLIFKGGTISNGRIVGDCSDIQALRYNRLFSNVVISGLWRVKRIYSSWFDFSTDAKSNTQNFRNMCMLTNGNDNGHIIIESGEYPVEVTHNDGYVIQPNSCTEITINGHIKLEGNAFSNYHIIDIRRSHDVKVNGNGKISGDIGSHIGIDGEWGMGISVISSSNVTIKNITIERCWGDCIYIGQATRSRNDYSENVKVDNVTCRYGRRQGLSLISGCNISIKNCHFLDTGALGFTAPGCGLDVEPNIDDATLNNILIERCTFNGNHRSLYGDVLFCRVNKTSTVRMLKCMGISKVTIHHTACNVKIERCDIYVLHMQNVNKDSGNELKRSHIGKQVNNN